MKSPPSRVARAQPAARKRQSAEAADGRPQHASAAQTPPARGGRRSRVEKSELIRARIFSAAAEIVGKVGYAGASIALITQRAGVAQGTFYNYFQSRQDLLDQLLPTLGDNMLAHIRRSAPGGHDFADLEERGFRAFFDFLRETPPFFRILNEAESFAPESYRQHFDTVSKGYVKFLRRSLREGRFPGYDERELEVIAFVLMAARTYLAVRYVGNQPKRDMPDWVVQTYMKFILNGLQGNKARKGLELPSRRNGG
jgi:AcrR family transcriptional regulator